MYLNDCKVGSIVKLKRTKRKFKITTILKDRIYLESLGNNDMGGWYFEKQLFCFEVVNG